MLTVETTLGPSKIHGLGLYAAQPIEKGTLVSYYNSQFDRALDFSRLAPGSEVTNKFIAKYVFKMENSSILFGDDARFINHALVSNLGYVYMLNSAWSSFYNFIALQDIPSGTELTLNYHDFDEEHYARLTAFVERRDAAHWPPKVKIETLRHSKS